MNAQFLIQLAIILVFGTLCSIQDIKTKKVSNLLILSGCLAQVIFLAVTNWRGLWMPLCCSAATALFYFAARLLTRKKLGMADVYFGIFQGLFLQPVPLCLCILLECLLPLPVFLIKKLQGRPRSSLPFVPFMALSLLLVFLFTAAY